MREILQNFYLFIYLFIYTLFLKLTYRSDRSADFPAWWFIQRASCKDVPFWGFVDSAAHLRGQIPENPDFGAENSNFHTLETTAPSANKILHNYKGYPSSVVQTCPKYVQDGGRPPLWKIEKIAISTMDWRILTKFDTVVHLGPEPIS